MAHKLDPLMCLLLRHVNARAARGERARRRLADACVGAFERVILLSHRVKFSPFVVFHAMTLAGGEAAQQFAESLAAHVCNPVRTPQPLSTSFAWRVPLPSAHTRVQPSAPPVAYAYPLRMAYAPG